jgi:hypothetical protein
MSEIIEKGVVHFTIHGDFMTGFFRDLWVSDEVSKAYNGMKESLPEITHDIITDILTGKSKLEGVNELDLKDDAAIECHGIDLSIGERWHRLMDKMAREVSAIKTYIRLDIDEDGSITLDRVVGASAKIEYYRREINFLSKTFGPKYRINHESLYIRLKNHEDSFKSTYRLAAEEMEDRLRDLDLPSVEEHIHNKIELDKLEDIEPTEDYSHNALWISPKGLIYGMTGDIANMLHIRMADMIAPKIPTYKKFKNTEGETESYTFLEKVGYMKLTNDWAMMDVDNNENTTTPEQVKALIRIVNQRSSQYLRIGYSQRLITADLLKDIYTEGASADFSKWFSLKN